MKSIKYKVLFLASWFPSRVYPVSGLFIKKHAEALSKLCDIGLLHVVLDDNLKDKTYDIEYLEEQGFPSAIVYYKDSNLKSPIIRNLIKVFRHLRGSYLGFKILKKKIGKFDFSQVNAVYPSGVVALLLRVTQGIPYIVVEHSSVYTDYDGRFHKTRHLYTSLITRLIFKHARAVGAVSKYLLDALKRQNLAKGLCFIVPNIIDLPLDIGFQRNNGKINILSVSPLRDRDKNISGLINGFSAILRKYQNLELHIVGEGEDRGKLEELAAEKNILNINVFFHGLIPHDALNNYFCKANFFILNSNYETFSVATAEAIAHGIPVVVTKCGGPEEFVTEEVGILIERQNEESLMRGLEYMINNWQNYNPYRLYNYAKHKFAIQNVTYEFSKIYNKKTLENILN